MSREKKKINYLSNKDFLIEIHRSKNTYCYFEQKHHANYDAIISSLDQLTPEFIGKVESRKAEYFKRHNLGASSAQLVFRLMTDQHIPLETEEKKIKKLDQKQRTNFPPFIHYIIENGEPREVGRSHWKDGQFSINHGKMTNKLAMMFIMLVEKYAKKGNWRGYSYNDEMQSYALVHICDVALRFNEFNGDLPNPFAFFTTVIKHVFVRVLNQEKRNQNMRDDLLEIHGMAGSNTRALDHEISPRTGKPKVRGKGRTKGALGMKNRQPADGGTAPTQP